MLVGVIVFETQLLETGRAQVPPGSQGDLIYSFPLPCSRIELRALGKISEGEELTVSYIDFLNVSEERKKQLKKQYYFDCTCEHCQKGLKDDLFLGVKDDPKVHTALLAGVCAASTGGRHGDPTADQCTLLRVPRGPGKAVWVGTVHCS